MAYITSISRWCPALVIFVGCLFSADAAGAASSKMEKTVLRKQRKARFFAKKDKSLAAVLFPGVAPEDYAVGEEIPVWVELVESKKTQVPYQYYDMPVCPGPTVRRSHQLRKNLGAKLQGYNIKPSPFEIRIREQKSCTPLCQLSIATKHIRWMRKLIERQYRVHMSMDTLPVLMRSSEMRYAVRGYPVGFKAPAGAEGEKPEFYLYNHLRFTVSYHTDPEVYEGVRIVGFDVLPVSIAHKGAGDAITASTVLETCNPNEGSKVINDPNTYLPLPMSNEEIKIVYSYEVEWVESDTPWSDRWDVYFVSSPEDEVHYFAIINSLMIVVFLTGAIATVMLRILKKDISSYNEIASIEDGDDEGVTGWKLVHGDVFRIPQHYPMVLSVAVGTGAQLGSATMMTIFCALLGVLNPMKKGQTLTTIILLYVLSGSVAGYISSRLYKFFEAKAWKRNTLLTATAFPGVLVTMFIGLDIFLAFAGAATAVSIWTIIALFLLWVCVSTPLVFVGSYFGYRAEKIEVPCKTNQIARFVPEIPWYSKLPYSMVLGGILPFGSVCIEMFFIMGALWLHQIYYVMGFLLAVVAILALSCSEVAIIMCYSQLSAEDHQWWWRSFLNTGATGIYVFIYALWFLSSKLDLVGILPTLVYLTYMSMFSMAVGLFCGSIGFLSTLKFNKLIYGALKVD